MRKAFINGLLSAAEKDSNIFLLTGDLGYGVFENFNQKYPERFINVGIAEQNMTGVAAGLALSGKKVFTYSIANFPTLRCLEQIRNDLCYHNADVKIISVGSGFAYGTLGYTHHGIEDISIMRCLPGMKIYSPACPIEVYWSLNQMLNNTGPAYMRLVKQGENNLHHSTLDACASGIFPLRVGFRDTILCTGISAQFTYSWILSNNIRTNLYTVPCVKPICKESLIEIANNSNTIYTVEEHQLDGGFGSAILEALHDLYNASMIQSLPKIYRYGVQNRIDGNMTTENFAINIINQLESRFTNNTFSKIREY